MAMKRVQTLLIFTAFALFGAFAQGEEPFATEYVDGKNVYIKGPKWHPKEDGKWLFTCRLEASAERLVKPIAHLHLYQMGKAESEVEGEEAAQEIVWEQKAIVRRNKFDKSYGSRKASFVRVFVNDLPSDAESITVEFRNEPPGASTGSKADD